MKFLFGQNGRLLLVGGKPLATNSSTTPTQSIALTSWYLIGTGSRFNIQTTAASGDTTADVPVVFSYTGGAPSSVQARAVDSNGAAIPGADWTELQSVQVDDVAKTGIGYLPGVRAGVGYRRQVRVGTSGTITATDAQTFNVGQMLLPWGQSNMRGTMDGYSGGTKIPGSSTVDELGYFSTNGTGAFFGPGGFVPANNSTAIGSYYTNGGGGLSMLRIIGDRLAAKFGRKVGVALNPWDQNGTAMAGFMNSAGVIPMLANTGTSGQNVGMSSPRNYIVGDYRAVAWHQGESDSGAITRAQRLADLIKFCQAHIAQVAKFGRSPSQLTFLFAIMGVYGVSSGNVVPQAEVLRAAVMDLVAYGATQGWDVRIGWSCIDFDPQAATPPDNLHFGSEDRYRSNRRLTQAFLNALDPANVPHGAAGPRLTGAVTRSGDDVTLTVAHDGGATLAAKTSGSPITGWYANTAADFSGTDLAVSNITILSASQIKVTVAGAPTTFYIKHCGHKFGSTLSSHPDVSNLIYDDFVYPTGAAAQDQYTGLPLQPTPDAIRVG
jgi:hypothetical protein